MHNIALSLDHHDALNFKLNPDQNNRRRRDPSFVCGFPILTTNESLRLLPGDLNLDLPLW
jgi:hypothetical protein